MIAVKPVLPPAAPRWYQGLSETTDIKNVAEQPGITRAEALTTAQNIMQANANLNGLFGFGDDA
ncbi:hypothetical protein, partial [Pseudomonas aeruginosa]|uniref:hypothetical protein n=1 Tax=Pseudomonas aeruginosa TaxID=287 RepID=UPI0031B72B3C